MSIQKSLARQIKNLAHSAGVLSLILLAPLLSTAAAAPQPGFDTATGTITDSRWRSGVPLGGVGVGKIEVLTDGSFGNFTINHNWDRPYGWAKGAFAAIRTQSGNEAPVAKMLRLPGSDEYANVPGIEHTRMQGWFPRAQIDFDDSNLPVHVQMNAFSSLIPHNTKDSALPVACLSYTVTNPTQKTVRASVLLAWPNLLGWGGRLNGGDDHVKGGGTQELDDLSANAQSPAAAGALAGLRYTTAQSRVGNGLDVVGEYFVGVRREPGIVIQTIPSWDAADATPSFWPTFAAGSDWNAVPQAANAPAQPAGAVAADVTLAPGQARTLKFYVVWAMPHMVTMQASHDFVPLDPGRSIEDRWSTSHAQTAGDIIILNLGKSLTPTQITIDQGTYTDDYPRGLRVEISNDGKSWTPVTKRTPAEIKAAITDGAIAVPLPPATGRYLRLSNTAADSYYWWSFHSLKVAVKEQTSPLEMGPSDEVRTEDVGHYWQNYWRGVTDIASYADKNSDRLLRETKAMQKPVLDSSLPFWLKLKLINCSFPIYSNTILTRDGRFAVQESPQHMAGALGTMDQRMAAHGFYTSFFPELDQAELEMFADCQQSDGRITHLDGNIHNAIGSADVTYGITDWPDLASSWVMQVTKLARWTGNTEFLDRMLPHIIPAMNFMYEAGKNDDSIPEGGSTYDYEQAAPGAFIYSASCYMGALRAAAVSDPTHADIYKQRLAQTQDAVMRRLWNGTFFRKYWFPGTETTNENSFVANQAGDWLARLSGLPRTLDPKIIHQSVAQTIARHQKPFYPVPPMEVTPEGKQAVDMCFLLQHEPYLGCEAIYENYVDDGLETLHRVYHCAWELNHSPWDQSLMYPAPEGRQGGLITYMTSTTSWNVLPALAGASLDVPAGRLYLSPRLATTETELHIPVYFSRFWAWLDYVPAKHLLTLRVTDVAPIDAKMQRSLYHAPGKKGDNPAKTIVLRSVACDGDAAPIPLAKPFTVRAGAVLDLSDQIDSLAISGKSEVVDFEVKAAAEKASN
ncbi:MAG: hypothetical protein JWQ02_4646 [Capsulimonas sp.]|nr:hypothetical protein [Capsulimonas sp.]